MTLNLYVYFVAFGLSLVYYLLAYCLALFFEWQTPKFSLRQSLKSLCLVFLVATGVFIVMSLVEDRHIANRIEHAFGGGFMAFLVCYLVARDSERSITRFQFFVLSFLVVTALGVANEIFEFFAQNYWGFYVAKTVNDTWLDLISNTVGACVGAGIFVPMYNAKK